MARATQEVDVATAASPTVRRRRLAAELRRLRGNRTGTKVAQALGWSPAKISRYELGRSSFPVDEVEKLLDFYGIAEPRRAQLLALAAEANQRGWWEDYAGALPAEYMEFIGLEAEATSVAQWQVESVPGLLQTEDYAREIHAGVQSVAPTPPGIIDQRVRVRMIRQRVLTERSPLLELSVVLDESALLRKVGTRELMYAQLEHMARLAELPNVELRIMPLERDTSLMADSFVVFGFSPQDETAKLSDVVSTENLKSGELYVDGETDTYVYRLFYQAVVKASLSPEASRHLIRQTADRVWG
jgi:transcriptional regulator with XRE-family HTH domain